MSAVLAHEPALAPEQPGLLGIEPPPVTPELRYAVCGRVHHRPEVRVTPDGRRGHLVVQIEQPPHAGHARPPFVVTYSVDAPDIPTIEHLAAALNAGADVLCICQGIDYDPARHQHRAWHCDRLTTVPRAIDPGPQPTPEAAP